MYQAILTAYLIDLRNRGFYQALLHSCPPKKNVDMLLNIHPASQTFLPASILTEW